MPKARSGERRQQILETLARMLQEARYETITTAKLARAVGVSEAALYRHFPSKARMYEALIDFIEESLFSRISRILLKNDTYDFLLKAILMLVLGFAGANPGMARILYGDVLVGEAERLQRRVAQIYDRIEVEIKQCLRAAEINNALRQPVPETTGLLLATVEGRIARFVRSNYRLAPAAGWERQWEILRVGIFTDQFLAAS